LPFVVVVVVVVQIVVLLRVTRDKWPRGAVELIRDAYRGARTRFHGPVTAAERVG
jgi:putative exporter of polyketide antibiotics